MACLTRVTTSRTSYEEPPAWPTTSSSSLSPAPRDQLRQRRRHSSYHTRSLSGETDNIQQLVDRFLDSLGRRLDFLEEYGQLQLDNSIERAYSTLLAVRDGCSHVSDEVIGAGRRRAKVLVDTLEERYNDVMARRETLEQKVQEGVKLMDSILTDFENRAYAVRDSPLTAAGELFDESRRLVDSGIERAREVVDDGLEVARKAKETLTMKIDHAVQRAREHGLITYTDLPEPWRVNPHIVKGYRFSETKLECLRSMVYASNELFNIWSHLIGLVIILTTALYVYPSSPTFPLSTKCDILIAGVFFFAACKCLVCSTLWHTMSSISDQPLMERFACVDYSGISLLVATSIMTAEYTAFYCDPVSRWTYIGLTALLGIIGSALSWHPTFNRADMAWLRVVFYVTLALTGFIPIIQLSFTRGFLWAVHFYAPITKSVLVYFCGAVLYAMKVPERWCPGMFDYVGGSHNIWHLAVLGGILFHYGAMQEFFAKAFVMAREGKCSVY